MSEQAMQYITHYGYMAIFVLIFLQEIGVPNPVPNELVLLFSGYLAFKGALYLPLVLLTAVSADFIGASILYYTFYYSGAYILSHKPKWLPLPTEKISRLSVKISAGGLTSVFLGRLTPFIRGYVSVIAGLLQIKPSRYMPLTIITAVMVCGGYVLAGRLLGPYWSSVSSHISNIKYVLLVLSLFIAIGFLVRHYYKKQKRNPKADQHPLNNEN